MLTERIMQGFLNSLLGDMENSKQEDIEALCKLMGTIGSTIDHSNPNTFMDTYFERFVILYHLFLLFSFSSPSLILLFSSSSSLFSFLLPIDDTSFSTGSRASRKTKTFLTACVSCYKISLNSASTNGSQYKMSAPPKPSKKYHTKKKQEQQTKRERRIWQGWVGLFFSLCFLDQMQVERSWQSHRKVCHRWPLAHLTSSSLFPSSPRTCRLLSSPLISSLFFSSPPCLVSFLFFSSLVILFSFF